MPKVYKVVRRDEDTGYLSSAQMSTDFGSVGLIYPPGKVVRPIIKDSYLFAFGSLRHAVEFVNGRSYLEIWQAVASRTIASPQKLASTSPWMSLDKAEEYWQKFGMIKAKSGSYLPYGFFVSPPFNTRLCSDIKLEKLIPRKYYVSY